MYKRHKKSKYSSNSDSCDSVDYTELVVVSGNHIYFYSDVCSNTILQLNRAINDLNQPGSGYPEIWLHINSSGGNVYDALAAVDTISDSPTPIITIVEGMAASAASMIAMVGDKRYIRTNGTILIHQLSTTFQGKKSDMDDEFQNLKAMDDKMIDLYVANTILRRADIKKIINNELEFGACKCIEIGIIDEIYTGSVPIGKRKR